MLIIDIPERRFKVIPASDIWHKMSKNRPCPRKLGKKETRMHCLHSEYETMPGKTKLTLHL